MRGPTEERIYLRHPALKRIQDVELVFVGMDIYSPDFAQAAFLRPQPITAAYVCLDDESAAMYAALALRRCLSDPPVPIVVRMTEEAGMATLLGTGADGEPAIPGLRAVGLLDITCTLDLVLGGRREILAHAIHQGYVQAQRQEGSKPPDHPSLVPWEQLRADLKESNRSAADDIERKLASIGCEIVPQPDSEIKLLKFEDREVEFLARKEHERWLAEKRATGWQYGDVRDDDRRIHDCLVAWDRLTEVVRDRDRDQVRQIPAVLAKADFEIRRTAPAPVQIQWQGERADEKQDASRPPDRPMN